MGGLQVSTKLCHSNTPVGQVSLNGILNIIILTQADDGGEEVYDVSWSSRKVWIKNCKKFQHCLNKPSPIPPNSETFGSLNYMAAPPSWISDSIHVFWVGSNTNLSEQFSYYISSAAFLLTFIKDNLILPLNVSSQLLIKFNVSEIWPCTTMMKNNHHHHPHKPPPAHPTVCVFAKIYSTFCRRAVSDWPIPWLHDFI